MNSRQQYQQCAVKSFIALKSVISLQIVALSLDESTYSRYFCKLSWWNRFYV